MEKHYSRAVLLTGGRGVGKTTVCQAVAELTRRRGYRPGGVITPALYSIYGAKVGFEAVDVGSGERWPLARTDQELGGPQVGPYHFEPGGLARALEVLKKAATKCDLLMVDEIGPLELERGEGFAPVLDLAHHRWSSRTARLSSPKSCSAPAERETSPVLSPALSVAEGACPACPERSRGEPVEGTAERFATPEENSKDSLPVEGPMHTLIVVRPALLDQLLQHLRGTECTAFNVTEENRDDLPRQIVETLWGDG